MAGLAGGCAAETSGEGDENEGASTSADAGTAASSSGEAPASGDTAAASTSDDDDDDAADSTSGGTPPDTTGGEELYPPPDPGEDVSVTAFEGEHIFFVGGEEGNHRQADLEIEFPEADLGYESIGLELSLRCPEDGGCDHWDRFGSLGIVENAGEEDERVVEVARFITPYRVEGTWTLDVSHLRPLLTGAHTMRVFIDTWVGPGHAQGAGWLVDARFDFTGGVPSPRPVAVVPIWPRVSFEVGNPTQDPPQTVDPEEVEVPPGADALTLVTIITGHGQGNLDNCAEFCQHNHGYLVGGTLPVQRTIWRSDCGENPIDNQQGTWALARAGWCPGMDVTPWIEDVTDAYVPGEALTVEHAMTEYSNTCHPESPDCGGCALGTGCEFDGGNHTAPRIEMSTHLVAWVD